MIRAVIVALAIVIPATACTAASTPAASTTSRASQAELNAPAQSASTTTTLSPQAQLASKLDHLLPNTNSCLLVTDTATGGTLYSHEADLPLTPASSQKLFVAAAALDRLGPDYRFTTTVVATRPPVGGVVDALWLVGGGDPLLATPEYAVALQTSRVTLGYPTTPLKALADQLAAGGVRMVRNGLHGDDSRYEPQRYLPTWGPTINHGEFDIGPLSALEVDQGLDSWSPTLATEDPPAHGAGLLARLLGNRGVTGTQGVDQAAPSGAIVLASVRSAPLSQIVGAMLRASDNQIAELLVRELDHQAGGLGTTVGGVQQVVADMTRLGVPVAGMSLVDGSGLSHANQVTCRALLAALGLGDQVRLSALSAGLPVAGVSGGMANFGVGTPLSGRLAGKGGYIGGVTALVARLNGPNPRRFALVANGTFSFTEGVSLLERVALAVAS